MIKIKTVDKNGENPYTLEIRTLKELANCKAHQKVFKQIREKLLESKPLTMEEKLLMNYMIIVENIQLESSRFDFVKCFKDFWQELLIE